MNQSVAQQALINAITAINLESDCWTNALLAERNYGQCTSTPDDHKQVLGVCELSVAIYKMQMDIAQSANHTTWRHDYDNMARIVIVGLLGLRAINRQLNEMFIRGSFTNQSFDLLCSVFKKQGIEPVNAFLTHREAADNYLKALRDLHASITKLFFPGPLGLHVSATRYQTVVRKNFNDVVKFAETWLSSFDITASHLSLYPTIDLDVIELRLQHADQLVWEVLPESTDDQAVRGAILFSEIIPMINELYDKGMFKTENIPALFKSLH